MIKDANGMQKSLIRTKALCRACLFADQGQTNMESVVKYLDILRVLRVILLHGISVPVRDQEGPLLLLKDEVLAQL